jgi:large subunit ribosomal protein L18
MIINKNRNATRSKVHDRIRRKLSGTAQRPRLNVYRSVSHIYAQLIDDAKGVTLVSASSLEQGKVEGGKAHIRGGNVSAAKTVGKLIAERAQQQGVTSVVFDRGGYLYHGRIKALAEAAREAGLKF